MNMKAELDAIHDFLENQISGFEEDKGRDQHISHMMATLDSVADKIADLAYLTKLADAAVSNSVRGEAMRLYTWSCKWIAVPGEPFDALRLGLAYLAKDES